MADFDRKVHWENIYQTKDFKEVSWYQARPHTSIDFIRQSGLPLNAGIIDVGGGDSLLVDHLLDMGYSNLTVLDISEAALDRARKRLGPKAESVKWIVADVGSFVAEEVYELWHDRAAFHFLTDEQDIAHYVRNAAKAIAPGGIMVLGTFSDQGPTRCSGIEIRQYSGEALAKRFEEDFEKQSCTTLDHSTPSGKIQNFTFCSFRRKG